MCHKVWHIWYVCHKCHKCATKCGTAQADNIASYFFPRNRVSIQLNPRLVRPQPPARPPGPPRARSGNESAQSSSFRCLKVRHFYVCASSASNEAQVRHQKRGLTRFLDILCIMHLMYVYIHESSEIQFLQNDVQFGLVCLCFTPKYYHFTLLSRVVQKVTLTR